jgi:hypothetical protein
MIDGSGNTVGGIASGAGSLRGPGLLVGFPSNHEFVHAVPKVLSGKRYSPPV